MDIFKGYNITEVNPVMGIGKYKSGSTGFLRMIDLGLKNQDRSLGFQPFIVMEDDCSVYKEIPEVIEVPDNSDIVYVGISRCGTHPVTQWQDKVYMKEVNSSIVKVYNMLSTHGIMITSALGASVITKCMMESYFLNMPFDLPLSYVQPYYNIYALKSPLVYQDLQFGGEQNQTKIEYNLNTSEDLPKNYYKIDTISVITSYKQ
jgi:hypothetical protein